MYWIVRIWFGVVKYCSFLAPCYVRHTAFYHAAFPPSSINPLYPWIRPTVLCAHAIDQYTVQVISMVSGQRLSRVLDQHYRASCSQRLPRIRVKKSAINSNILKSLSPPMPTCTLFLYTQQMSKLSEVAKYDANILHLPAHPRPG